MSSLLRISEAASLALHAMVLLANTSNDPLKTREIADSLRVSPNHLSKVLQRLVKVGLVESVRGRGGGYKLARTADRVTLGEIYETIEGPIRSTQCLLSQPVCKDRKCILSDLLISLNQEVRQYLSRTRLSDMTGVHLGVGHHEKRDSKDR